jgi:hypothetical protein
VPGGVIVGIKDLEAFSFSQPEVQGPMHASKFKPVNDLAMLYIFPNASGYFSSETTSHIM